MAAKLLKGKSGTRDSNPRLQPWQFDVLLKTQSIKSHGVFPESPKNPRKPLSGFLSGLNAAELRQNCGRTFSNTS
jgi:hypothetical protein